MTRPNTAAVATEAVAGLGGTPTALYAIAAYEVGVAVQIYDGEYRPGLGGAVAIGSITLAIIAAGLAVAGPRRLMNRISRRGAMSVLAVLLAFQFALLLTHRPDSPDHGYLRPDGLAALGIYRLGLSIATALMMLGIIACFSRSTHPFIGGSSRFWLAGLLITFAFLSGWCLSRTSLAGSDSQPRIDVFVFQQRAARAFMAGHNPYAIDDFPDLYQSGRVDPVTREKRQEVYGPGMSDGRTLRFGFPYLPMSLYLATIGYAVCGDFRLAQAAALIIAAILIYRARPSWLSALVMALLLFSPRVFFVLISGWTEPFLVLWLATAVYCARRRPALLPIALGLLLATKQYMLLALPLTLLLVPRQDSSNERIPSLLRSPNRHLICRGWLKLMLVTGAVAVSVTAPLALWDWKKFYFSVVTVQQYAPFRWDALSYLTWHAHGHGPPSAGTTILLPALAALAAMSLCLWRAPRSPAGFAGSVGLVSLVFFAFSKQAFANYYFFVIGALCCAAAVSGMTTPENSVDAQPPDSTGDHQESLKR